MNTHNKMNASSNSTEWVSLPSKRFPGKMYFYNTVSGETSWDLPETETSNKSNPTMNPDKPYVFGNWSLSNDKIPPKSFSVEDQYKLFGHNYQSSKRQVTQSKIPVYNPFTVRPQVFGQASFGRTLPTVNLQTNTDIEDKSTFNTSNHSAENKNVRPTFVIPPKANIDCEKKNNDRVTTNENLNHKSNFQCEHQCIDKCEITHKSEAVTPKIKCLCKTNFIERIVPDEIVRPKSINQCNCINTESTNQNEGHNFALPKPKNIQCVTDQCCFERMVLTDNNVESKPLNHGNHQCTYSKTESTNQNGGNNFAMPNTKKVHCIIDQCCIERMVLKDKNVGLKPIHIAHEDNCNSKTESINQNEQKNFVVSKPKNTHCLTDQCCIEKLAITDQYIGTTFHRSTKNSQYDVQSSNNTDQNDGQKTEASKLHCHCNDKYSIHSKFTSPNTAPEVIASKPKTHNHCQENDQPTFTNEDVGFKFPIPPPIPKKINVQCQHKHKSITNHTAKASIANSTYYDQDDDQSSIFGPDFTEKKVSKFTMVPPSPIHFLDDDNCSIGSMGITKLNLNHSIKRTFIVPPTFNFQNQQVTKPNLFLECKNNKPIRLIIEENSNAKCLHPKNIAGIMGQENIKFHSVNDKFVSNQNKTTIIEEHQIESPKEIDSPNKDKNTTHNCVIIEQEKINFDSEKDNVPNENKMFNNNIEECNNIGSPKETDVPMTNKENGTTNCEIMEDVDKMNCNDLRSFINAKRRKSGDSSTKTGKDTKINLSQKPEKVAPKKKVTFYFGTESDVSNTEMEANDTKQTKDGGQSTQNGNFTEDIASNMETYYVVVDKEVILHEFDILDYFLKKDTKCNLVIPYKVMYSMIELARGESRARELVLIARCRVRRLAVKEDNIIVQPSPIDYRTLEDEIVQCCVEKMKKNSKVMLLTNNTKLHSLAKVFHVKTCDMQTFKDIYVNNNRGDFFDQNFNSTVAQENVIDKNDAVLKTIAKDAVKINSDKNNAELWKKSAYNYVKDCKRVEVKQNPFNITKKYQEITKNIDKENTKNPTFHAQSDSSHVLDKEVSINAVKELKSSIENKARKDENSNFESIDRNAKSSKSIFDIDQPIEKGSSIFDVTKEKTKDSFEVQLRRCGLDVFQDPKDDILGFKGNEDHIQSEKNVVINSIENFKMKTKMLEEKIELRQEEFLCCFRQIMEDILTSVFLKMSIQQPLDFHEALQNIATLYEKNAKVKRLAINIFNTLYDRGVIKKMKILKADKIFGVVSMGLQLVQQLKMLKATSIDELRHTELSLKDLLSNIQDPTCEEEILYQRSTRNDVTTDSTERKRNFVKDRKEIISYLKKHFPEMAGYDENEQAESKWDNVCNNNKDIQVVRTCGKNLSLLKLNKSNAMTMTSRDTKKTNVNNDTKNYKIPKKDNTTRENDKKSREEDKKSREDKKSPDDKKLREEDKKSRKDNKKSREEKKSREDGEKSRKVDNNRTDVKIKVGTTSITIFEKTVKKDSNTNDKYKDLELSFVVKNSPKDYNKSHDATIADDVTEEIHVSSSQAEPKVIRLFDTNKIKDISNINPEKTDPMTKNFQLLKMFEQRFRNVKNDSTKIHNFGENSNKTVDYNDTQSDNRSCSMSFDNCVSNDRNFSADDKNCRTDDKNNLSFHRNGMTIERNFASNDRNFASIDRKFASIDIKFPSIDRNSASNYRNFATNDRNFASNDRNFASIDRNFASNYKNGLSNDSNGLNDDLLRTKLKSEIDIEYFQSNYEVKKQFLMQIYDMFKQCHKFMKRSVDNIRNGNIEQDGVYIVHKIAYSAYVRIGDVAYKLNCIMERESSHEFQTIDNQMRKKSITYKQLVQSASECALATENALEKLMFLTENTKIE